MRMSQPKSPLSYPLTSMNRLRKLRSSVVLLSTKYQELRISNMKSMQSREVVKSVEAFGAIEVHLWDTNAEKQRSRKLHDMPESCWDVYGCKE